MKNCLMIVDVQNGFVSPRTRHIVPELNSLMRQHHFDNIAFTRFINTPESPYIRYLDWHRLQSEQECALVDSLIPFAKKVFSKYVYTGINSETLSYLKNNDVKVVFLAGIDTDCCVLNTAIDLFENGIRPYVLEFCSASNGGQASHQAALTVLNRSIGQNSILFHKEDLIFALSKQE